MPDEECINCGRKVNWGRAFSRQTVEDSGKKRVCPYCKDPFDEVNIQRKDGTINLGALMKPSERKRRP